MDIRDGGGGALRREQGRMEQPGRLRRLLRTREDVVSPPPDAPTSIYMPGTDPARVLVIGDGPAVGYGFDTHGLAVSGRIARALSTATSRGVVVDIRADPRMTPLDALNVAKDLYLRRYDAIVVTLGMTDAQARVPADSWAQSMRELLAHLAWGAGSTATLVVGTVPHAPLIRTASASGARTDARAATLNQALATIELPRTARIVVLEHDLGGDSPVLQDTGTLYREWAGRIAAAIVERGISSRFSRRSAAPTLEADRRRVASLHRTNILDTATDDRFDGIVALTQHTLSTPVAALCFIDDERLWVKSIRGFAVESVRRADSLCDHTIRDDRTLVIPDAASDPRYADMPFVAGPPHFRFYAGHPIESPDGERIGSLCVLDSEPRTPSIEDIDALQRLAFRVQEELYRPLAG